MRLSLAKAFLRPHRSNPNLHIMLNSTVTKILLDTEGPEKRASAVEFIYKGQKFTIHASKEIILSAGAVQTPQLLLLSGIGDRNTLETVGIEQVTLERCCFCVFLIAIRCTSCRRWEKACRITCPLNWSPPSTKLALTS